MPSLRSLLMIAALCSLLSTAAAAGPAATGSNPAQIERGTAHSLPDASHGGVGILQQNATAPNGSNSEGTQTNRTDNNDSSVQDPAGNETAGNRTTANGTEGNESVDRGPAANQTEANRSVELGARQNLSAKVSCYENASNPPANASVGENATAGVVPPNRSYHHNHTFFRALWSGDPDHPNLTRADRTGAENGTLAVLPSCTGDMVSREPSNTTLWNRPEHDSFRTGIENASHPVNVTDTRSGIWIRDAYVAFFSIEPSTVVHKKSGTERLVRANGTVRAIHDYRVYISEFFEDDFRVLNTSTNTTLYANGTAMDNSTAAQPTLNYTEINGTTELQLVTTISTNLSEIGDDEIDEYELTVTDSRTVQVENLSEREMVVEPGVVPNGRGATTDDYRIGTVIPGSWQSVQFDGGYEVQSKWRFYTRSPPGWANWSENTTTPVRPLETHAVRTTEGPAVTVNRVQNESSDGWRFVPSLEATYPTNATVNTTANATNRTTLPPEIRINRSETFTTADRFTIRSAEQLRTENFEINGLVRGNSIEQPADSTNPTLIREVNITSEVVNSTDNSTDLLVRVEPTAGFPIAAGNVTVATGQSRVERPLSGDDEITVTVDQGEVSSAIVTYRPAQIWWEQGRAVPVRDTQERVAYEVNLPDLAEFIDLAVVTLLTVLPAVLALYGYDVWTRGKFVGWYNP
ncbi:hypothetical protein HISP_17900 (plasmid) [Haloarcula hispanica N601]|uniref:Uncharacterized protein n=2 Tax=Haloarcula hispanica TaxID=51589 RepID=V5TS15_HALHI|nr:hypothetical protein [Haloarcula hispanica]AEM58852.1 conserved hypothetical protein [Haloarcula hispanica ATCC 33960]AHB67938.1 hypothetical protein HISP_17900 [Haloarcula hispanica N601]